MALRSILTTVQRKRIYEPEELESGNFKRCLSRFHLASLGVGSTLGVGVYVLVGSVALKVAGPAVVLSFLIAAVAALFAGLCYAEFAARLPRAGAAYAFTYAAVGELAAFVVGWNIVLETMFGTASVARGLSLYVDSMLNGTMSEWFRQVAPVDFGNLSQYFDIFAFGIVIVLGVAMSSGVKESAIANSVFALVNAVIIVFIIVFGSFKASTSNWSIPSEDVPIGFGVGGFFPYGVWGMLRGAAVCFYGFVGFDGICSAAEETHDPRRSIPTVLLSVLLAVCASYCGVAIVVTMMVPYFYQDSVASVATAFSFVGWEWARWVVSIGAVFGICSSMFGALFPLPRLLHAMSSDGLLPPLLAKVGWRQAPVLATLMAAGVVATVSSLLPLEQLLLMTCVGTLLAYSMVAASVVLLRYESSAEPIASSSYVRQTLGFGNKSPNRLSANIVHFCLAAFVITSIVLAALVIHADQPLIPSAVFHGIALMLLLVMALQPTAKDALDFKTPMVPLVPCLSIYFNVHLMLLININTWIRVIIWLLIGIPIYITCVCCYKKPKGNLSENLKTFSNVNGKQNLQIIVEAPTPPDTVRSPQGDKNNNYDTIELNADNEIERTQTPDLAFQIEEDVIVKQAVIDHNEEREAKIIDLLDQVIQAEEDTYGEVVSLKETKDPSEENIPHRMSLSELSEAGSDASLANVVPPKYDVIVQVHREDLSKVNEEPEVADFEEEERVTFFNESETSSRTDESGYSDTTDNNNLNESFETKAEVEDAPRIPTPPPPPPDTNFFAPIPVFKSYTIPARPSKASLKEDENKPRESVQSNNSYDDSNIVFGSSRQQSFMSKLDSIYKNKMTNPERPEEKIRRCNSTGNVMENVDMRAVEFNRPSMFIPTDLKKELLARQSFSLRPTKPVEDNEKMPDIPAVDYDDEPDSLSRDDLKSKLENIFASGPKMLKPRLMKSNPPTPEEAYQTDASSTESIPKLPKMEKNDTLKRQKDKFSEVLNSFKLNFNTDDAV